MLVGSYPYLIVASYPYSLVVSYPHEKTQDIPSIFRWNQGGHIKTLTTTTRQSSWILKWVLNFLHLQIICLLWLKYLDQSELSRSIPTANHKSDLNCGLTGLLSQTSSCRKRSNVMYIPCYFSIVQFAHPPLLKSIYAGITNLLKINKYL